MNAFERWSVWVTTALTVLTGVVFIWMKYVLTSSDPFAVVNHPLQPLVLKLHILVSPLLVFALGVIAVRHVWNHFRAGIVGGRKSGIVTALVAVTMIVTGYLIQAVTQMTLLKVIVWTHVVTGIVYGAGAVGHWMALRRGALQQARPSGGQTAGRSDVQAVGRPDVQTIRRSDVQGRTLRGSRRHSPNV